jgi:hypothetical protein
MCNRVRFFFFRMNDIVNILDKIIFLSVSHLHDYHNMTVTPQGAGGMIVHYDTVQYINFGSHVGLHP